MAKAENKGRLDRKPDLSYTNNDQKESVEETALKKLIGARIKRVRQVYFKNGQEKIGDRIFEHYGQNIMSRLEQGNGSAINVLKLLQFYHRQGINLNFLFEEDANENEMVQYNPNSQDTAFAQSIIAKYESAMTNLYKLKDLNAIAIDKNINDMRAHIESISKLTTIESIDLEKE